MSPRSLLLLLDHALCFVACYTHTGSQVARHFLSVGLSLVSQNFLCSCGRTAANVGGLSLKHDQAFLSLDAVMEM